jgi:hypothetical protein
MNLSECEDPRLETTVLGLPRLATSIQIDKLEQGGRRVASSNAHILFDVFSDLFGYFHLDLYITLSGSSSCDGFDLT